MSDHTVDVFLEADGTLTFTPNPVRVGSAGKVVLRRSPSGAEWRFADAGMAVPDPQFEVRIPPDRRTVTIVDHHHEIGSYAYWVTVEAPDGRRLGGPPSVDAGVPAPDEAEPPPVIQNEPSAQIKK